METETIGLQGVQLVPVPVIGAEGSAVRVLTPEGEVVARNALAFPYQPVRGDLVLAIGQLGQWFIIGVLSAGGDMAITFPANVTFSAPRGEFKVKSGLGLELHSPNVKLRAGKLEFIARSIIERADSAWRWIKGLMQVRAGNQRTEVDEISDTKAQRFVVKTTKDVKIDGEQIFLG